MAYLYWKETGDVSVWRGGYNDGNGTITGNQPGADGWIPNSDIRRVHWGTGGTNDRADTNVGTRNNSNSKTYAVCDLYQDGNNWGWSNKIHGDNSC